MWGFELPGSIGIVDAICIAKKKGGVR